MNIAAIICAAGSSSRFGSGVKKEYMDLGPAYADDEGKPLTVLGASATVFASCQKISIIVIAVPAGEGEDKAAASLPEHALEKGKVFFTPGGKSRRESVYNALVFLKDKKVDYVLIHDGARPWATKALIERVIEAAVIHKAVIPVVQTADTPKLLSSNFFGREAGESGFIQTHLRRSELGFAQTPQGFAFPEILAAHEKAALREKKDAFEFTDDAEVWAEFAGPVAAIMGEAENRKITFPGDLPL